MKRFTVATALSIVILGWSMLDTAAAPSVSLSMQGHLPPPNKAVNVYFVDIELRTQDAKGGGDVVGAPGTFIEEGKACTIDLTRFGGEGTLEVRPISGDSRSTRMLLSLKKNDRPCVSTEILLPTGKVFQLPASVSASPLADFQKAVLEAARLDFALRARRI